MTSVRRPISRLTRSTGLLEPARPVASGKGVTGRHGVARVRRPLPRASADQSDTSAPISRTTPGNRLAQTPSSDALCATLWDLGPNVNP
jgi:hypothetical protein